MDAKLLLNVGIYLSQYMASFKKNKPKFYLEVLVALNTLFYQHGLFLNKTGNVRTT